MVRRLLPMLNACVPIEVKKKDTADQLVKTAYGVYIALINAKDNYIQWPKDVNSKKKMWFTEK